mmetsp:Transcript_742/g.2394  ORF Transcript_742/g.2394 Transcript_742/m.2394 type:complete len:208 (-) Transcript_742:568-1191(-)
MPQSAAHRGLLLAHMQEGLRILLRQTPCALHCQGGQRPEHEELAEEWVLPSGPEARQAFHHCIPKASRATHSARCRRIIDVGAFARGHAVVVLKVIADGRGGLLGLPEDEAKDDARDHGGQRQDTPKNGVVPKVECQHRISREKGQHVSDVVHDLHPCITFASKSLIIASEIGNHRVHGRKQGAEAHDDQGVLHEQNRDESTPRQRT